MGIAGVPRSFHVKEGPVTDAENALAKQRFIAEFVKHGFVARACRDAKVARQTYYSWMRTDPQFAQDVADAVEDRNDAIREELYRRGVEGWDEPVYQGGRRVGDITKYSDSVLLKIASARLEEYRSLTEKYAPKAEESDAPRKVEVTIREVSDWDSVSRNRG
jgi:uncharacterized protein YbaA (DUF1428 family)